MHGPVYDRALLLLGAFQDYLPSPEAEGQKTYKWDVLAYKVGFKK